MFFENIRRKVKFEGNYPSIFILSGQSYVDIFLKSGLYMPQIYGVSKKSKTV